MSQPANILVLGGGHVGMYATLRLRRMVRRGSGARIVLVDPRPYLTYQPFLAEAAAGSISPRHLVVPLRRVLPDVEVITGRVRSVDPRARVAQVRTLAPEDGAQPLLELPYDALVVAPGAVSHILPIPGLAEHGIGMRSLQEAIGLRNHVLEQLDVAASTRDPEIREAALTFVFVGGGYAGVETLGELEDMARYATRYFPTVQPEDLRWVLVDAADRILPEAGTEMGGYVLSELRRRNVDVRLETRLASAHERHVVLSDGSVLPARTLVWTAGTRPNPILGTLGLPRDAEGRLCATTTLQVEGHPEIFTAGDCAAVPDLSAAPADADSGSGPDSGPCPDGMGRTREGESAGRAGGTQPEMCAPNAQHALRQARVLADNLHAWLRDRPLTEYRHAQLGSVASLGLHKGVAHIRGLHLRGLPAWAAHRAYHLARLPTPNRKIRVLAEWLLSGLFRREIVSLGSLEHPRAAFQRATDASQDSDADGPG